MLGPELVQQTADIVAVIKERMKTAQSRQESYADVRRRPLEFLLVIMCLSNCSSQRYYAIWEERKVESSIYLSL